MDRICGSEKVKYASLTMQEVSGLKILDVCVLNDVWRSIDV
jgi:hypothetical protein